MRAAMYVEELIGPEHKARAIWELAGRLDLSRFCEGLNTAKAPAGRPAWDPQLVVRSEPRASGAGKESADRRNRLSHGELSALSATWGRPTQRVPGLPSPPPNRFFHSPSAGGPGASGLGSFCSAW